MDRQRLHSWYSLSTGNNGWENPPSVTCFDMYGAMLMVGLQDSSDMVILLIIMQLKDPVSAPKEKKAWQYCVCRLQDSSKRHPRKERTSELVAKGRDTER